MSTRTLLTGLTNGFTGRKQDFLVGQGIVIAVGRVDGSDADVMHVFGDAMVLPGLRDAHIHAGQWATLRQRLDVRGTGSAEETAGRVREAAKSARSQDVLVGYGFRDGLWADPPHKDLLERAAPGRAVLLLSNDLHAAWLSPAALVRLGRPEHPTGLLREQDAIEAAAVLGSVPTAVLDEWVLNVTRQAAARGVTALLDFEVADNVSDWTRRWHVDRQLDVRVQCAIYPPFLEPAGNRLLGTGGTLPGCGGMLTVGPCKLFVDGSLNTRTALCHDPYPDVAQVSDVHGLELLGPEELSESMRRAWSHGLHPAVHAIGDRACGQAIDAFETVGCPGRIEHAQLLTVRDVARLARLDVVVGAQPAHCPDDRDVAEVAWPSRTERAFVYGDLLRSGVRLELGSDAPVAPLDPWDGIASAVTRTDDERPPWHPEQAIPLQAAVRASCGGSSEISVGDVADLVVVPADLPHRDGAGIREIDVLATMAGGRWTYLTA